MATIDDVARLAGVSTATVSRALRGLPLVSEETVARVVRAAETLGYVASPSASRLAGGRTGSIGLVVPRISRWFSATIAEAAQDALARAGYDLLLYNLFGREEARRQLFHSQWLRHRVDAIVLVAIPLRDEDIEALSTRKLPGVTVSSGTAVPRWPSVRIDDAAAARAATEYLIGLGHTRIAHICGGAPDELACATHLDRRSGYHAALRAAGIEPDPAMEVAAEFTNSGGDRATGELLRRGVVPTAIFAACDEMAMGALSALRRARLRVPEDVSVVGIDDHDAAAAAGLTTVAQPVVEQGRRAAALLLKALSAPVQTEGPSRPEVVPTRLVVRESTGPCGLPGESVR